MISEGINDIYPFSVPNEKIDIFQHVGLLRLLIDPEFHVVCDAFQKALEPINDFVYIKPFQQERNSFINYFSLISVIGEVAFDEVRDYFVIDSRLLRALSHRLEDCCSLRGMRRMAFHDDHTEHNQ